MPWETQCGTLPQDPQLLTIRSGQLNFPSCDLCGSSHHMNVMTQLQLSSAQSKPIHRRWVYEWLIIIVMKVIWNPQAQRRLTGQSYLCDLSAHCMGHNHCSGSDGVQFTAYNAAAGKPSIASGRQQISHQHR